jgi:hypothetical protein
VVAVFCQPPGGASQICVCTPHDWGRIQSCGQLTVFFSVFGFYFLLYLDVQGVTISEFLAQPQTSTAPAAASAPPPPPPPPPPPVLTDFPSSTQVPAAEPASGDMGAVFSELNRGEGVTKRLRKVDKSEMIHKNPSLRASATAGSPGMHISDL